MCRLTLALTAAALFFATPALADWRSDAPKTLAQCSSMGASCGASTSTTVTETGPDGSKTTKSSSSMTCLQYIRAGKAPAFVVLKTTDESNFDVVYQPMGQSSSSIGSGLTLEQALNLAKTKCSE